MQNYYEFETGDDGGLNGIGSGRKPLAGGKRVEINEWFSESDSSETNLSFSEFEIENRVTEVENVNSVIGVNSVIEEDINNHSTCVNVDYGDGRYRNRENKACHCCEFEERLERQNVNAPECEHITC